MSREPLGSGVPLDDEDIHFSARAEFRWLSDNDDTDLNENHRKAYQYYKQLPTGREKEGLSKVQSTDVSDAVEWMLPTIVKSLIESPDVIRFDPVGPEDQAQADVESDYVHHAFMKKSNGFLVTYETVKDALLLKNGVTYTYWDEATCSKVEPYDDLTELQLAQLMMPTDGSRVELLARTERETPVIDPQTGMPLMQATPEGEQLPVMMPVFDVELRRYNTRGKPCVECCIPENFMVRWDHHSILLEDARFCCYVQEKNAAHLVALGYDPVKVDQIPTLGRNDERYDEVRRAREDVERSFSEGGGSSAMEIVDRSQRMVRLIRAYMTMDINGDGYEERIVVVMGGDDGQVLLDWFEVEENPFDSASPFIAAHKFWGYSLYDKLRQLQDLSTKFIRMIADNTDLINNPQKKIIPGMVDATDVFVQRVGGLKRVEDMSAYEEMPPVPVGGQAFAIIEWAERKRAERVGIDPNSQGMSKIFPEESMNTGFERLMTAKEEVVSLIIRAVAETWFKPMMIKLRKLVMQHQRQSEIVKLASKWVQVDPRNWTERTDTTIKVGLGTGDRIKKINGVVTVIEQQVAAAQNGMMGQLVTPSKLRAALADFVRYAGLGDPDEYWLDPVKIEQELQQMQATGQAPTAEAMEVAMIRQQQQAQAQAAQQQQAAGGVDPQALIAMEQIKAQSQAQSDQMDAMMDRMKMVMEQQQFMVEERRKWAELLQKAGEARGKLALEGAKAAATAQQTRGGTE